jgi:hypothetical protein
VTPIQVVPVIPTPRPKVQSPKEFKRPEAVVTATKLESPVEVVRPRTKSLKSHLKSPFSKSSTSLAIAPAVPAFPVELASKAKAESKEKDRKEKPSKKSKSSKSESSEASSSSKTSRSAHAKPVRPVPYAAMVQLNMIMDGGSQDYWLNRAHQVGEPDTEEVGNGVEVGGFKDENGQIWWDAEEKVEWTSLIPKDESGEPSLRSETWVSFTHDRRSSVSSEDSYVSMISTDDAEDADEYIHYGVVEAEPAKMPYANRRAEGSMLFPIDIRDESSRDLFAARAVIAQAQSQMLKTRTKAAFEDHFLSYDSESEVEFPAVIEVVKPQAKARTQTQVQTVKATKKSGFFKSLLGKS